MMSVPFRALFLIPYFKDAFIARAAAATARKDWPEAVKRWQKLLDLQGLGAPATTYVRLAQAHAALHEFATAESLLLKGAAQHPEDLTLARKLADAATARKDWPEAVKRWQKLLDLQGLDAPATTYVRLAQAHAALREFATAESLLLKGAAQHPEDLTLARKLADAATARKDWPEAVKRWQKLLDLQGLGAPATTYVRLAQAHAALREFATAEFFAAEGRRPAS